MPDDWSRARVVSGGLGAMFFALAGFQSGGPGVWFGLGLAALMVVLVLPARTVPWPMLQCPRCTRQLLPDSLVDHLFRVHGMDRDEARHAAERLGRG